MNVGRPTTAGENTYSSRVGKASQRVPPRKMELRINIQAILRVALKMIFAEEGERGKVAP